MAELNYTAYGSLTTIMDDTELQALADGADAISTSYIDGATSEDLWVRFEFYISSLNLSAQTAPAIHLWLVERFDGTNYADGDATDGPAGPPTTVIRLREVSDVHRVLSDWVRLPPERCKVMIENQCGAALPNDANGKLKYRVISLETI